MFVGGFRIGGDLDSLCLNIFEAREEFHTARLPFALFGGWNVDRPHPLAVL